MNNNLITPFRPPPFDPSISNHLRHRIQQGQFVIETRRKVGKTSALLLYAAELRARTDIACLIVVHHPRLIHEAHKIHAELAPTIPRPTIVHEFKDILKFVRGRDESRYRLLVDEFMLHPEMHYLPTCNGYTFYAGVSCLPHGMALEALVWK